MSDTLSGIAMLFGGCVVLPLALVGLVWLRFFRKPFQRYRRRKRQIVDGNQFAHDHGWQYRHDMSVGGAANQWKGDPFRWSGRTDELLEGTHRGWHVRMLTYTYLTEGPLTRTWHYYTVVAVTLPAPRPRLELIPRDDESMDFHEAYEATSENPQFFSAVFHQNLVDWLLRHPRRGQAIRFDGNALIAWEEGRMRAETDLEIADFLIDLLERMPDYAFR